MPRSQRRFAVSRDVHFEKARAEISVTPPMLTYVSAAQPMNACSPMVVQESGSTAEVSAEAANALRPMAVSPAGRFTFVTVAEAKALPATDVTDAGTVYALPAVFFAAGNAMSCFFSLSNRTPSSTA